MTFRIFMLVLFSILIFNFFLTVSSQNVRKFTSYGSKPFYIDFDCVPEFSPEVPTSVHKLRPSDITVIAGLGDSLSTGCGVRAESVVDVLRQNRGEAWSMGGRGSLEENIITIPNILRKFNPGLKGWSEGYGNAWDQLSWLNVGVIGDKAEDMPNQMDVLISKMEADSRIDIKNDWKLVTMLTGGNEMCSYCENNTRFSPEKFKNDFRIALEKLKSRVPRVLVNLVAMMDIRVLPEVLPGLYCSAMQWKLCYCAKNAATRPELKDVQIAYYEGLLDLATSGRYDTSDDFTVVLQPHMLDMEYPRDPLTGKYDPSFISHDCFHPNEKAHAGLAYTVWNTMLTPVGNKTRAYPVNEELPNMTYTCPTKERPYIFTNKNSGL